MIPKRSRALVVLAVACSSSPSSPPRDPAPGSALSASTAPSGPPPAGKGRVADHRFSSRALGVDKRVLVYLPGRYDADPTTRWPVFYYLHGLGGAETNWIDGGHLPAIADRMALRAIVVMPDGDSNFYIDSPMRVDHAACMKDGKHVYDTEAPRAETCVRTSAYATYVTRDLVTWVDTTFRTNASREGRAIAGLSMGGFGALQLGMRNPDLFAAAASHSGVDALLYKGPYPYERDKVVLEVDPAAWGVALGPFGAWIRDVFGADIETWRAHDPAQLAQRVAPGRPAIYLDVGTEDRFLLHNGAQYLHDVLAGRGVEHAWYIGPGGHDFRFWADRLPHSLAFLRDHTRSSP